jgi:peptidoglycan DL-endopeptidase CwlO
LRILARRLLPVIAFALALSLVLTGLFRQSRSQLTLGGHRLTSKSAQSKHRGTGVSGSVGSIPGITHGVADPWPYAESQATHGTLAVQAKPLPTARNGKTAQAKKVKLLPADLLVVDPTSLPVAAVRRIRKLAGVQAAVPVAAGRIQVNGVFVNVLGVDPTAFRPFAAKPTAGSATLWNNISAGGMAISYTMGRQDRLSLNKPVKVIGARTMKLPVAGFGTVGIGGVDAVVSAGVAKTLGLPSANAIVISAPSTRLDTLMAKIKKLLPAEASVAALVTQIIAGRTSVTTGSAGEFITTSQGAGSQGAGSQSAGSQGLGLSSTQLTKFLSAAVSRVGFPYVWGGDGPTQFDCSGLVQWSLRQAGVVMPRVAADQARTGPLLRLTQLQPGDLLFYHTDPTAPSYISHVAIYVGNGMMLQAPEPGMDVEIVKADFGAGFAGAIRIFPKVAAQVAGNAAG